MLIARSRAAAIGLSLLLACNVFAQSNPPTPTAELLQAMLTRTVDAHGARELLPLVYAARDYRPVWTERSRIAQLRQYIARVASEGLQPDDYYAEALRIAWDAATVDGTQAMAHELLASEALLRLITHLRFGKVEPTTIDRSWNLTRRVQDDEVVSLFGAATQAPDLIAYLTTLAPAHASYAQLRGALAAYRERAAGGGWPTGLAEGETLREGMRDARVTALRARLASDDPTLATSADPEFFDAALTIAVREFQRRHGLAVDGAVGKGTRAALNVPITARIDQIRVNLERARWVLHDLTEEYLAVNIAGFEAYLLRRGDLVWRSKVIVGRTYRRTPVFHAAMQYLVLNPTWTVPPTILSNDVLPKLSKDSGYLDQQRFDVIDRNGNRIDPAGIDWSTVSARSFPYLLRQRAGADNALGRIKFMFPNGYDVYLHDTPQRQLFARAERTFSSGCIRVEHALELAELLLDDQTQWSRAAIEAAITTGATRTVVLPKPLEVLLLYWTAMVDSDGTVRHYPDVYQRDAPLLAALNRPEPE